MSTVLDAMNQIAPGGRWNSRLAPVIEKYAPQYNVTGQRLKMFLSQAGEETDKYNSLVEYASGSAYEGRTDLGNTIAGDGVRFKGRGVFMITGRGNYRAYSREIYNDDRLVNNPQLLEQPDAAVLSAFKFWTDHNLNAVADTGNVTAVTKIINGGTNGLSTRLNFFNLIKDMAIDISNSPLTILIFCIVTIGIIYFTIKK